MMQQLATQRSQIAALPDNPVPRGAKQSTESELPLDIRQPAAVAKDGTSAQDSFADMLNRESSPVDGKPKNASTSASSVKTDAKQESSEQVGEQADSKAQSQSQAGKVEAANSEQVTAEDTASENSSANVDSGAEKVTAENTNEETVQQETYKNVDKLTFDNNPILTVSEDTSESDTAVEQNVQPETQTDYLSMIEAVRALQEKLSEVKSTHTEQAAQSVKQTAEDKALSPTDISILPTEIGEFLTEHELLTQLQDWLNKITVGDLPADMEAAPLQQLHGAEQVLADFLTLLNQVRPAAETESADANSQLLSEMLAQSSTDASALQDGTTSEEQVEDNILALAVALLESLPGQRNENTGSPSAEIDPEALPELNSGLLEIANDPIVVAEPAEDDMLNQAKLLVSLMRQVQQTTSANTQPSQAQTTPAALQNSDTSAESLLEHASDKTIDELVQVMTDSASKASPALTDNQLSQIRSQLTTGLEEMRAQLKQGHEPGIDLAALVTQTMREVAPDSSQNAVLPVLQDVQQLTQLAALSGMSSSQEHQLTELVNVAREVVIHETRQQHGDTLKSLQQQAVMDKPANIHQPEGQQQIAEKIRWMVNGRQSMAEIRLDPPEMGSMQIRLNVSGDSASVSFVVQSQHAKEALADAMPRLRDMFAEQGIDLGESFVSQQQSGEAGDGEMAQQHGGSLAEQEFDDSNSQETQVVRPANGLIDDYV